MGESSKEKKSTDKNQSSDQNIWKIVSIVLAVAFAGLLLFVMISGGPGKKENNSVDISGNASDGGSNSGKSDSASSAEVLSL